MEEKRNYEILKFVMHGDKCYMSTDIVNGKPLIDLYRALRTVLWITVKKEW